MKRILLILAAIILCGSAVKAQSDYKPMVVEGRTWTYFASHYDGELGETGPEFLYNITIDGTTEIGGVTYHNAYRYKGDKLDKDEILRIKSKKFKITSTCKRYEN